ncbi:hypothetical protein [Pseudomonas sp. NFACC42-2]|uniref:hypothetical protein n=1 Tax=Pseudomonas sp. NFACC42-2 TaxID=1566193 RepID=UPI0008E1651D|nr:hypothetical protein [Pseudomonas sp. NFACC42-2]SFS24133.1 hypothetical protein SAMN03159318_00364 [Pseudomonas sp. NFACC42-2]
MSILVNDHISISEKLKSFGLALPNGLTIIPSNLATANSLNELRQQVESDTVRTLLRQNNITYYELFEEEDQPPYLQQYSFEWYGPTLIISAGLLTQDPNALSITLGLITNYLYDLFKGSKGGKASLDVIYQNKDGSCKEIHYSGPHEGLPQIYDIVKELEKSQNATN